MGAEILIQHGSTIQYPAVVEGAKLTLERKGTPGKLTFTVVKDSKLNFQEGDPVKLTLDGTPMFYGFVFIKSRDKDGTIDVIASNHSPHSVEEKARSISRAPSGMIGLETSLAVTLTQLYHTKKMDLPNLIRRMATNPADLLKLNRGHMSLGAVADLVIFDPDEEWTIDAEQFASKARNTPFDGRRGKGKVKYTITKGEVIYQDNQ